MSSYEPARTAFAELHTALGADKDLHHDVSECFRLLLTRYNTQIYENRHVVGAAAERLIGAVFNALGKTHKGLGVHVRRFDILIGDVPLSVKGSFRGKRSAFRLVNTMGESEKTEWNEATVFVVSGLGIGYADPDLLPAVTRRAKDVLLLPYRPLASLWKDNPKLLFRMDIPTSREDKEGSDIASRLVVDEILRYGMRKLKPFDKRTHED